MTREQVKRNFSSLRIEYLEPDSIRSTNKKRAGQKSDPPSCNVSYESYRLGLTVFHSDTGGIILSSIISSLILQRCWYEASRAAISSSDPSIVP